MRKKSSNKGPRRSIETRRSSSKVGGDRAAARRFAARRDFGIPARGIRGDIKPGGRTKGRPGATGPMREAGTGRRESGVGSARGPAGSGSGGDASPDIIGVGTPGGSSVGASGTIGRTEGPDISEEGSARFASGPPARGRGNLPPGHVGGTKRIKGTTHRALGESEAGAGGMGETGEQARRDDKTIDPLSGGPARKEL